MKTVAVIGAGRAGRAVAKLMRRAGWKITALSCRRMRSARAARRFVGAGRATTSNVDAVRGARMVILAVPDRDIAPVWREIGPHLERGATAFHLCGNESSKILRPARGLQIGSIHPIRSFADPKLAVAHFKGTFCGVEGPKALDRLVRAWGGIPLRLDPRAKPFYHAGAVFASNYVVAAVDAAVELLTRSKIPRKRALEAVLAMADGTLRNLGGVGLPGALTGPIERGDHETIRSHMRGLATADGRLLELYAELARRTIRVARRKGTPAARLRRIEKLLK